MVVAPRSEEVRRTARNAGVVLFVVVLIAVIVGVDLLLFRDRSWLRLLANVGIVAAFAAFYLAFLRNR